MLCIFFPYLIAAKSIVGIATGQDYAYIDSFTFTFEQPSSLGHIHAQTIVSTPQNQLLVIPKDVLDGLAKPWRCEDLVANAKVKEFLTEAKKDVVAYDLVLNVERSVAGRIHVFIARCGQPISVDYILEFYNDGGIFIKQFDVKAQGTFQQYIFFALIALIAFPIGIKQYRLLIQRQSMNDLAAICYIASLFFGLRMLFFTIHCAIYASNGSGMSVILFMCEFLDMITVNCWMVCGLAIVHGVYVARPEIPPSSERQQFLFLVAAFVMLFLLSMMWTSFFLNELEGFGLSQAWGSMPYFIIRIYTAIVALMRGPVSAKEENTEKKLFLTRFASYYAFWLASTPVIVYTTDNWMTASFRMEMVNFGMVLLYFHCFSPERFGWLFTHSKANAKQHPYSEFGLPSS